MAATKFDTPRTGPRYIVLHSLVGSVTAGSEYVPAEGEDVQRLLDLEAIAVEMVAPDAPMPPVEE